MLESNGWLIMDSGNHCAGPSGQQCDGVICVWGKFGFCIGPVREQSLRGAQAPLKVAVLVVRGGAVVTKTLHL